TVLGGVRAGEQSVRGAAVGGGRPPLALPDRAAGAGGADRRRGGRHRVALPLPQAQAAHPSLGHSHHDQVLAVVSMGDHWGREYPHGDPAELSTHSIPAYAASEPASVRAGAGDPPPSYEEAVGHADVHIETEPPPQYEDIVNTSSTSGSAAK
ncbi:unnamed protein product, partial [Tetraodon nigroviridis]